jgi:hypothetical protein
MILARAFGGSPRRRGSVSSDEAEDTVENNSFIPQRCCNDLTPHKPRKDLKSFASRGDLRAHTSRADLKSTNLKPARSHADLRIQSCQGEIGTRQSTVPSCEDQDMQFRFIIQDRPVVVGLGLDAWRAQCPEMLESGQVVFHGEYFVQMLGMHLSRFIRQTMISSSHNLRFPHQTPIGIPRCTYFVLSYMTGLTFVHVMCCSTCGLQAAQRQGLSLQITSSH